nr:T-cell activation Rho GTPase-activating protein-like [Columba livia]
MGQVNCCRGSRGDPELVQQCMPILELPEPLLRQRVRVTQGRVTRKRDLLLFSTILVIGKPQRGNALRPQLCLALDQLRVLSSGTGAAGDATEEEDGKHTTSLVLVWPCGSCVVTFRCRAVKELWVRALLGTPEGAGGAHVSQLPSFKPLLKKLRARNAAMTLHASSLERLVESQAKAGAEQRPAPVVPSSSEGGVGHVAGELGEDRGRTALLSVTHKRALVLHWGCCCPSCRDLLALLQEHGTSTEGIFQLVAGERASWELREALDSGAQVQLESQPVHLLATILKEFLRKIPSKLLQNELYQDWMSALQKTSRQERLAGLKNTASKLREPNLLLLKQLLTLLRTISSNTCTSRMTTANLAICVGLNLLSPPEEDSLPLDVLVQVTGKAGNQWFSAVCR